MSTHHTNPLLQFIETIDLRSFSNDESTLTNPLLGCYAQSRIWAPLFRNSGSASVNNPVKLDYSAVYLAS